MTERLTDEGATLRLYESILNGANEPDQTTPIHTELKLSGLVGRDLHGQLVVRNRIYAHVFDRTWLRTIKPVRGTHLLIAKAVGIVLLVTLGSIIAMTLIH